MSLPPLPPGFQLQQPQAPAAGGVLPPLPPGFVVADVPQQDEYTTGQALAIGAGRGLTDTGMGVLQRASE